jgi:hypothetical protein
MTPRGIVPNVAMLIAGGGKADTSRRPSNITSIMVNAITVGEERKRAVSIDKVASIRESIRELGLLQPIGVRRRGPGKPFLLIYGYHRFLAKQQLMEDDPTQDVIAAAIYPEDMPDWACELNELAENLHRSELTPKERDAHTALYAGLLKEHGSVVDGDAARSKSEARTKGRCDPNGSGHIPPTVTRKVATDLGINDDTVRYRIRNAAKQAARSGVAVTKPTPEAMSGEELVKVGRAALQAAESDKAEAARTGKPPRHVNPQQPVGETIATVRLDVTDPAPFIDWCRTRIAGKHKPMSLGILKSYAVALAALIAEIEAAP